MANIVAIQTSIYAILYQCGACGKEARPVITEARANNLQFYNPIFENLPGDTLVAVNYHTPEGWQRIDPFSETRMVWDNMFCELCAPGIRAAIERARREAVAAFANKTE